MPSSHRSLKAVLSALLLCFGLIGLAPADRVKAPTASFLLQQSLATVRASLHSVHGVHVTTAHDTAHHQSTSMRLAGDCALTPSSLAVHATGTVQLGNSQKFSAEYVIMASSTRSHTWTRSVQTQHRWVVADFAQIGAEMLNVCPSMLLRQFIPPVQSTFINSGAAAVDGHAVWHLHGRLQLNRSFYTVDLWLDQTSHYPRRIELGQTEGSAYVRIVARYSEFNAAPTTRAPAPASPTPLQSPGGGVSVQIVPNPMPAHARATMTVTAAPGSRCTARIIQSSLVPTSGRPAALVLGTQQVGKTHTVVWTWQVPAGAIGGNAMADCTIGRSSTNQVASFATFS